MESCAPFDGPSMGLTFSGGANQPFPNLSVNWWGSSQPSRKPGTYTHSNGMGGKVSEGFSGRYCRIEGSCATISKIYMKVTLDESGGGEAELEGVTPDGAPIHVKAKLKLMPQQKDLRCG